ncbi:MAG: hypothetical protein J6C33_05560 [Lachnospiraceae bacterium]|nr:hypothetical protein [Lachnospiraceae bacterium]
MSNTKINIRKIYELPEVTTLSDQDVLIQDDTSTTHKFTLASLIEFIKNHTEISNFYVHKSTIDEANGVVPLDSDRKIPSDNIKFGKSNGDVYEGSEGAALETSVNAHITDETLHITSDERAKWNNASCKANMTKEEILTILGYDGEAILSNEIASATEPADADQKIGQYWIQEYA